MTKDILYANCSEIICRVSGFKGKKEEEENFIKRMMNEFKPYNDDTEFCKDFAFYDEMGKDELIVRGRDDSHEDTWEWAEKEAKKLKLKFEEIDEPGDGITHAVGNNLFYKIDGKLESVNLSYSNIFAAHKINKDLLALYTIANVNKNHQESLEDEKEFIENNKIKIKIK